MKIKIEIDCDNAGFWEEGLSDDPELFNAEEVVKILDRCGRIITRNELWYGAKIPNSNRLHRVCDSNGNICGEMEIADVPIKQPICQSCEATAGAEERQSFGMYAGVFCEPCAIAKYRDHCGINQPQGDPYELDEQIDADY